MFKGHPVVSKRFERFEGFERYEGFVYFLYFGFLRDGFGMPSGCSRVLCKLLLSLMPLMPAIMPFFKKKPRKVWRFAINSLTLPRQNHSQSYGASDDRDLWRSRGY